MRMIIQQLKKMSNQGSIQFAFAFDHVLDAHEVHIAGEGASSITLPLPIILWTEKGLVSFLSSSFHHDNEGHHIVEKKRIKLC